MDGVLSGFGLAGAAGLNAYIPLLLLGIANRFGYADLSEPYSVLGSNVGLGVLVVLLLVEVLADKVPGVDSVNDIINTVIRPAAGGVLLLSSNGAGTLNPVLAAVLGLLMAGSVHATKTSIRPFVTASTVGMGNPVVSIFEDILAVVGTLVAIFMPFFVIFFLIALFFMAFWTWRLWSKRRRRKSRGYAVG